jgi:hypothetical protein
VVIKQGDASGVGAVRRARDSEATKADGRRPGDEDSKFDVELVIRLDSARSNGARHMNATS